MAHGRKKQGKKLRMMISGEKGGFIAMQPA
jgi:hypothetical protein